jgi:hypothetical protein
VQTLRSTHTLWPAGVVAGIKTEGWASASQKAIRFQALALQHNGKAAPDTALQVQAIARITTTTRKRMVGGFYSYDNQTHQRPGQCVHRQERQPRPAAVRGPLTRPARWNWW